eukprot:CAMPEP_0181190248 /NCGR_PEP_ID=MMETSP1096-20121128/12089_1 /TAXON_ID=156174 ORGANISM="Chrysochromulina ericina, Strain CCMP281" /NCGR_SAMPLE_ID=MMETSP1096 /ASSEMBLY_ACC=CAM_ASM_000453 /LENGTH=95 /DNA_ID=CAMNT_0023279445 /DNA_START=824 /DNA_END=1108 /DNA_ORIENTATION=-
MCRFCMATRVLRVRFEPSRLARDARVHRHEEANRLNTRRLERPEERLIVKASAVRQLEIHVEDWLSEDEWWNDLHEMGASWMVARGQGAINLGPP